MRTVLILLLFFCSSCLFCSEPADRFLDEVIRLNKLLEPELDEVLLRKEFSSMVDNCRTAIADLQQAADVIAALNKILLSNRNVSYLSNIYWRDASLSAALLNKQCNCLAGSTLYVCIGKSLKLPIHMVLSPGHAFVRWEDQNARINIETTDGGSSRNDAAYLWGENQVSPHDVKVLRLGQSLSDDECLAELKRIVAFQMRSRNDYDEAIKLMQDVCQTVPHREDYRLELLSLEADHSGDRSAYINALFNYLRQSRAPGIQTSALLAIASELSNQKRFDEQRDILLAAFRAAPKNNLKDVLHALAFCHRSLKDYRGGRRYLELYGALIASNSPEYASYLYNLAILQKNDDDLPAALQSIEQGIQRNPESWNLQVIKAGYLVLNQQREEGLALFKGIKQPRGDQQFWNIMQAWFYAVSRQDDAFYHAFEHALNEAKNPRILTWIAQDVDLDHYRDQERFKGLLKTHRTRLLGGTDATVLSP